MATVPNRASDVQIHREVPPTKGFTKFSNRWFAFDPDVRNLATVMTAWAFSHPDGWPPSIAKLVEWCRMSEPRVLRARTLMQRHGEVTIIQGGGRNRRTRYALAEAEKLPQGEGVYAPETPSPRGSNGPETPSQRRYVFKKGVKNRNRKESVSSASSASPRSASPPSPSTRLQDLQQRLATNPEQFDSFETAWIPGQVDYHVRQGKPWSEKELAFLRKTCQRIEGLVSPSRPVLDAAHVQQDLVLGLQRLVEIREAFPDLDTYTLLRDYGEQVPRLIVRMLGVRINLHVTETAYLDSHPRERMLLREAAREIFPKIESESDQGLDLEDRFEDAYRQSPSYPVIDWSQPWNEERSA